MDRLIKFVESPWATPVFLASLIAVSVVAVGAVEAAYWLAEWWGAL
ncbi:hypothetical protein ACM25O_13280 [Sulfitobacter pontiacus]